MPSGRPTIYTAELVDQICEAIENSVHGIDPICKQNENFPVGQTVRRWLKQYPEFRAKYALAKEFQAEKMADETIEVAYDDRKDWKIITDDEGNERTVFVAESVNRSRLKVDALKWHASKLAPKKYGMNKLEIGAEESLLEKIVDKL